jgi:uncharacterized membrane protein
MRELTKKNFDLGGYIGKGFDLFKKNPGTFIVFTLVYFIIIMVMSVIPVLGPIANVILGPSIAAGFFILANKAEKEEQFSLADGFEGIKTKLAPFAIFGLISIATFGLLALITGGYAFFQIITQGNSGDPMALANYFIERGFLIFGIFGLVSLVAYLGFVYAPMFIYFENMSPLDAIKSSFALALKNPVMLILFLIVGGLLAVFSILLLFVGILAGIPIFYNAIYAAWKDQSGYQNNEEEKVKIIDHLV